MSEFDPMLNVNQETACPYCGKHRDKPATRRYECKFCGEQIFLKKTPDNRQKRPMTVEQAKAAEAEWQADYQENKIARLKSEGLPYDYQSAIEFNRNRVLNEFNHPDVSHIQINTTHPCGRCDHLNGRLYTRYRFLHEMPVPRSDCEFHNDGRFCNAWIECVFR